MTDRSSTRTMKKIGCSICGLVVHSLTELANHVMSHAKYTCESCGKRFVSHHKLTSHLTSVHLKLRPFSCRRGRCGQKFVSKYESKYHQCLRSGSSKTEAPSTSKVRGQKRKTPVDENQMSDCSESETESSVSSKRKRRKITEPKPEVSVRPRLTVHGGDIKRRESVVEESAKHDEKRSTKKRSACAPVSTKTDEHSAASTSKSHGGKGGRSTYQNQSRNQKRFPCCFCHKTFTISQNRNVHERNFHGRLLSPGQHKHAIHSIISNCGQSASSDDEPLSKRVKKDMLETEEMPFLCSYCGKGCSSKRGVKLHERLHTGETPFLCKICGKGFTRKKSCQRHEETAIHTNINNGTDCLSTAEHDNNVSDVDRMKQKMKRDVSDEQIPDSNPPARMNKNECSICGRNFKDNWRLLLHKRVHLNKGPFTCTVCGCNFNEKWSLLKHENTHTPADRNEATHHMPDDGRVDKTLPFVAGQNLSSSEPPPKSGEKSYKCSYCGKSFSRNSLLVQHERFHAGDGPFKCTLCCSRFRGKWSLKNHEAVHQPTHQESPPSKPPNADREKRSSDVAGPSSTVEQSPPQNTDQNLACSYCGKKLKTKARLVEHQRIHTGITPFRCPVCGNGFTRKANMEIHLKNSRCDQKGLKRPTDDRSSDGQINQSKDSFAAKSNRNRQLLTTPEHSARLHNCSYCGKSFTRREHLVVHERGQHISCTVCGTIFARKDYMKTHQLNHCLPPISEDSKSLHPTKESPTKSNLDSCVEQCSRQQVSPKSEEKNHSCSYCGKFFQSRGHREEHEWTHTDERPFKCSCGAGFIRKARLVNHEKKCHTVKQNESAVQGHTLDSAPEIKRNRRSLPTAIPNERQQHTPRKVENPFACSYCEKSYATEKGRMHHEWVHVYKQKPFACDVCGTTFTRKGSLKIHLNKFHKHVVQDTSVSQFDSTPSKDSQNAPSNKPADTKSVSCPVCFQTFPSATLKLEHIHLHHHDYQHPDLTLCYICGSLVKDAAEHRLAHANQGGLSKFGTTLRSPENPKNTISSKIAKDTNTADRSRDSASDTDASEDTRTPDTFADFPTDEVTSSNFTMTSESDVTNQKRLPKMRKFSVGIGQPHETNVDTKVKETDVLTKIENGVDMCDRLSHDFNNNVQCSQFSNRTFSIDTEIGGGDSSILVPDLCQVSNKNVSALSNDLDLSSEGPLNEGMSILDQLLMLGEDFYDEQLLEEIVILPGSCDEEETNRTENQPADATQKLAWQTIVSPAAAEGDARTDVRAETLDKEHEAKTKKDAAYCQKDEASVVKEPTGVLNEISQNGEKSRVVDDSEIMNDSEISKPDNTKNIDTIVADDHVLDLDIRVSDERVESEAKEGITCAMCGLDCLNVGVLADHILEAHAA